MRQAISRRAALGSFLGAWAVGWQAWGATRANATDEFRLATFTADVTPPLGHPLMGGGVEPAREILDPLAARGLVLLGAGDPLVFVSIDWCEIRNDAYEAWRQGLAEAAGTRPERVLLASIHQHDAPVADLTAERILREHEARGSVCDVEFHARVVAQTATAMRQALEQTRRCTHLGLGQARVERVASNRRFYTSDGTLSFGRTSATTNAEAQRAPEGAIDPWLRTLSFWDGDGPLAAMSSYAVHPMSYYGRGGVTSDFIGLARRRRQEDDPRVWQMYFSGCSGNVTAGKYNDGSELMRPELAARMYRAMVEAWKATERVELREVVVRRVPLLLEPRTSHGFSPDELRKQLQENDRPFRQCLAALGLSWQQRVDEGRAIDVVAVDWGAAIVLLLPAESYVEYQLYAQSLRPDAMVFTIGYGEQQVTFRLKNGGKRIRTWPIGAGGRGIGAQNARGDSRADDGALGQSSNDQVRARKSPVVAAGRSGQQRDDRPAGNAGDRVVAS